MKKLAIILFFCFPALLFAQVGKNEINHHIEVTGTAELKIIPDEIFISINLKERQEGKVKISIEKQEQDLKSALSNINISLEDLVLSDANAEYIRIKWKKKDVIASNDYLLKVGNAVTVGQVFEKLDDLNIEDAYIAKVSHSKMDSLNKEVKILAIKAAKNKAEYLLEAIGEKLGKPQEVKETTSRSSYSNVFQENVVQTTVQSYSRKVDEPTIEFQKIILKSSVHIKFGIE